LALKDLDKEPRVSQMTPKKLRESPLVHQKMILWIQRAFYGTNQESLKLHPKKLKETHLTPKNGSSNRRSLPLAPKDLHKDPKFFLMTNLKALKEIFLAL